MKSLTTMPILRSAIFTLFLLLTPTSLAQSVNEEDSPYIEGPVNIIVGADPTQFPIGWSDGVCYIPVENARLGDTLTFNFFLHNVYKMPSQEAMENCDFSEATLLSSSSPYEYKISSKDLLSGPSLYFACEISSHCFGEQRLQVNLEPDTGPRTIQTRPLSKFVLGTSSTSCALVRTGKIPASAASRIDESECSEPELREPTEDIDRVHYFRSCLGPPITLTPGGVINQASVLHYPFPYDRRVLLGTRTWEFVQGDIGELEPVNVDQLYIHHIAGSIILGNGAENIRQSEEDAAFDMPYGMLSGDFNDRMIFHLIDLRNVTQWLECVECRCKDGEGTYLGFTSSDTLDPEEEGPEGGVSCCTNCTDLMTPTVDYRLRYNVTYTELDDIDFPIEPLIMISADIAPVIDRYVEFDVPQYQDLPIEHRLPSNPKVQVLERVDTLRNLFGGFFPGARFTGADMLEIYRCIGHLHIAALGMWLYDDLTGELICHNDVVYGDDAQGDKGFLRSIGVINYDPPKQILADRKVRLVTHYDAEILHTGVMGLIFLVIAEKEISVSPIEAQLNADLCVAPYCDVSAVLPNGGCRNSLEDDIICKFGGLCKCEDLLSLPSTIGGCDGVYMSDFGNVTVGSLCAEHCGCGEQLLEESIVEQIEEKTKELCRYATDGCSKYLANVYACAMPWAEGSDEFQESVTAIVARKGKKLALKGTKLGSQSMHRFDYQGKKENMDVNVCDPQDWPVKTQKTETASNEEGGSSSKFHPLYLFPVIAVVLIAALALYSWIAKNKKRKQDVEVVAAVELDGENA